MLYTLYNLEKAIAEFNFTDGEIKSFTILQPHLLPKQLERGSKEMFQLWLRDRSIDLNVYKHRELARQLLGSRDKITVAIKTNMFSVSDTFTCFPKGEYIPREQLWDKQTQENVSAFILVSSDTSLNLKMNITPNMSTDGSFTKTWRYEDGLWWLYKVQSKDATMSEYSIAKALNACGWSAAAYELVVGSDNIKTLNFVGKDEFFEPYESLRYLFSNKADDDTVIYENIKSLGEVFEKDFRRILLADAVFMNSDRHMRNFGVIRSARTGGILRMAPNFDNNQAYQSNPEIPYSTGMLRQFINTFGLTAQDKTDAEDLLEVCEKKPYLEKVLQCRPLIR